MFYQFLLVRFDYTATSSFDSVIYCKFTHHSINFQIIKALYILNFISFS